MDIGEFRDFCIGMDGVEEKTPFSKFARSFESTLVFYVKSHMFAICNIDDFTSVGLRLTAEKISELFQTTASVEPPHNPALKLWVSIRLGEDITDDEIYSLTREAYETVKAKYTKRMH